MTPSKLDEPPAWLAERNLSKSSAAGIEDGELYCQNVVAGTEKPEKPNHVRDCLAWYGNRIRQRGTLYCHQIVTGVEKPNNPKEPVTYVDDARQVWSILECMIHPIS